MDISSLENAYRAGTLTPSAEVARIYDAIEGMGERPVWISLVPREEAITRARALEADEAARKLPLYGIPFAVKDNFDVAGIPTTAACPAFAHTPEKTATIVQKLLDAGAILIGKTNMDQFATGLVGTRTPYGICSSAFSAKHISGGSSSGSAVAVASGLVSFSLGTDTAGSGRVPAAFNNLVGLKPTRGLLSTNGLLPACRTLDCATIFAETCADASRVFAVACGFDADDAYSRTPRPGEGATPWSGLTSGFRFGVLNAASREFFGDEASAAQYEAAVYAFAALGGTPIEFDYTPFRSTASLLYKGPWVAERLAALKDFFVTDPDTVDPTVGGIISGAAKYTAVEAFDATYELESLRRETAVIWQQADFLLLPTAATHYTIEQVQAAPIELNTNLGYYTNFVNLLDLAAVAVPAGFKTDNLPFSVTLVGQAFTDEGLLRVADRLHRARSQTLGGSSRELAATPPVATNAAPNGCIFMTVVGAHLAGQPLNGQLTQRKARLIQATRTHGDYRLYALANTTPPKPGLVYSPGFGGEGIEVEVWAMPEETVGSFLNLIPPPLGLGTVRLADGSLVKGFLCEPAGLEGAEEITHLNGWRRYIATKS
ncbi:allophanate hydrolase [Terracidiphilus gabretensis]|uniref:allophanate hydrolase n=1 Tax=Terracidiphilus gabretensis TaxID=1577687 RepID=UPI00071C03DA|nr:allophanate hydrolase [Terracidiphilus gabretensis]